MSEIIAEATVEKSTLDKFLSTYLPLVSEAKIHFNEDGLATRAVDPGNVGSCFTDVAPAGFESYEPHGAVTIGANLERFDDYLDGADAGDLVHLSVDMETRMLNIEYGPVHHELGLIDPEHIRQEPDDPDLDLPCELTLTGKDLKMAIDQVDLTSDHVEISADPDERELSFKAEGDVDSTTVSFGDEDLLDADVSEKSTSLFSMEYMTDLVKPIPKDSDVTIRLGTEFPIEIEWDASGGHQSSKQMLAPRISTD